MVSIKKLLLPRFMLLLFVVILLSLNLQQGKAEVNADWGDIVDVHYLRFTYSNYTEVVEDNNLSSIYLSTGSSVPTEILAKFPEANADYILSFKEGIIGLGVNEKRNFTSVNPYGTGEDFYFAVTLNAIQYDASAEVETTTDKNDTTTTTTSTTTIRQETSTTQTTMTTIPGITPGFSFEVFILLGLLSTLIIGSKKTRK